MLQYLTEENLLCRYQSGYQKYHSCKTAITKIYNDIVAEPSKLTHGLVIMLDMSAAFDTLKHDHILKILSGQYGFGDVVLNWFKSYFNDRKYSVAVNQSHSDTFNLTVGVPQGSILCPLLFILFTKNLQAVAAKHGFSFHAYADDIQLYTTFLPESEATEVINKIQECMQDIQKWMTAHYLKINVEKTKLLEICPFQHQNCAKMIPPIKINSAVITPSKSCKSLGFHYDEKLSFERQVSEVVKTCCNYRLRNLYRIGSKLSKTLKHQLVQTYILTNLDYCNAV